MKKLTLLALFVVIAIGAFAQADSTKQKTLIVNGKDINLIENEYIEIVCYTTTFYGKKWAITFDTGEEFSNWKGHKYKDENGSIIDFKTPMDAVNYVVKCGWKYVDQITLGDNSDFYIYYLMYKKKK